jgi:hypothetical protein
MNVVRLKKSGSSENRVLPVTLAVGPDRATVFDNPSVGLTKKGDPYDNIAKFLKAVGRNPKSGERANLSASYVVGAKGWAHIKQEKAELGKLAGKMVNKVAWYIWDENIVVEPAGKLPPPPKAAAKLEPDNIPW